jgi:integrase
MRVKLTDKRVQNVKPPRSGRIELTDTLEPQLSLRLTQDDRRTWALRLWTGPADKRVQRRVTLGHPREIDGSPVLSLAEARKAAREVKQLAAEGKSLTPGDAITKGAFTFGKLIDEYLKWAKDNKRPRTVAETERVLRHRDFDSWRDRPAASVNSDDVRALRDAIHERGAAVQATRSLRIVGALASWAVSEGKLAVSPATGVRPRTTEVARDRTLSDAEVAAFCAACDGLAFPFGPMFKLLALTAQRLREVAEMEWSEVSFEERLWKIPGRRCKNGREHHVHLSAPAMAILTKLAKQRAKIEMLKKSKFVFTTTGGTPTSGFSRSKDRLDAAMAKVLERDFQNFTLHDLRRTAASRMASKQLRIAPHVIDRVLNHSSGAISGVTAVYIREEFRDERAAALDAWGRHVVNLTQPNVVPLRA